MPERPDPASVTSPTADAALDRVEREVTALLRSSLEAVWAHGYGDHDAVDRFTYSVLAQLDAHGPTGLTELTGRLGLSKPTASRRVARLAAAGLVETESDGRTLRIALSPTGDAQVRHVRHARMRRLGDVLDTWTAADGDTLATLLHRLNTDLDRHRRLPS